MKKFCPNCRVHRDHRETQLSCVDASFVGKALPPIGALPASAGRRSGSSPSPSARALPCVPDLDAARAAGHPDVVAPPTFAVTFTMPLIEAFLRDPAFGWDYARMVHGDQSIRPAPADVRAATSSSPPSTSTSSPRARASHILTLRCRGRRRRGRAGGHHQRVAGDRRRDHRRGRARVRRQPVGPGDALPPLSLRVTRADLVRYAGASGDFNPIHWSDRVAVGVGLPGRDRPRHADDGARRPARHPVGGRPRPPCVSYGVRFTRPVVVPDDDEGARVEVTGTVRRSTTRATSASPPWRSRPCSTGRPCWPARQPASVSPPDPIPRATSPRRAARPSARRPCQVVVAQRVGQAQEARRAERLARDHRHLGLLQDRGREPDGVVDARAAQLLADQPWTDG